MSYLQIVTAGIKLPERWFVLQILEDKLQTLADWLNMSSHWLRNGPPPPPKKALVGKRSQPGQPGQLNEKEARLLVKLRSLSEHQVYIVAELIDQLALEREIWAESSVK